MQTEKDLDKDVDIDTFGDIKIDMMQTSIDIDVGNKI